METSSLWIPLGIAVSSFLGSWHCAGMCGPFAALAGSRRQLWPYHLGRLLSYFSLGVIAGGLGQWVFTGPWGELRTVGAWALSLMLILMGLQYFLMTQLARVSHSRAGQIFQTLYRHLQKFKVGRSSFVLGLLAGLLPCMWLYTYVLAAAASKSAWAGGFVMVLFWLGGLPALSAVSMMITPSLKVAHKNKQRLAGLVMVGAGFYALASHLFSH